RVATASRVDAPAGSGNLGGDAGPAAARAADRRRGAVARRDAERDAGPTRGRSRARARVRRGCRPRAAHATHSSADGTRARPAPSADRRRAASRDPLVVVRDGAALATGRGPPPDRSYGPRPSTASGRDRPGGRTLRLNPESF